jgi:uncharacterized delta-60 repeat protein
VDVQGWERGSTASASSTETSWVVARLLPDGTLDRRFGRGGRTIIRFFPGTIGDRFSLLGLGTQSDGSLILAGHGWSSASSYVGAFARLRKSGELDREFGEHGRVVLSDTVPRVIGIGSVAIDEADRIVSTGWLQTQPGPPGGHENIVIRLESTGALDRTYGSDGVATIELAPQAFLADAAVAPGRLLVGGQACFGRRLRSCDMAIFAMRQ